MFLNDPMLYGATLPIKDVNMQTPFVPPYVAPWQNQYIPPIYNYGFTDYQKFPFQPFLGVSNFPIQQFPFQQFPIQQFPIQQFPFQQFPLQQFPFLQTPFAPPVNFNPMSLPFYGWQRPFVG